MAFSRRSTKVETRFREVMTRIIIWHFCQKTFSEKSWLFYMPFRTSPRFFPFFFFILLSKIHWRFIVQKRQKFYHSLGLWETIICGGILCPPPPLHREISELKEENKNPKSSNKRHELCYASKSIILANTVFNNGNTIKEMSQLKMFEGINPKCKEAQE